MASADGPVLGEEQPVPDDVLIRRIQDGDERAFGLLFGRHVAALRDRARRWLPVKLQRKVSVSDILQETRLVVLRRCLDFEHKGDGSVRNWLLRIVERKVRDVVRAYKGTAKRTVEREVSRDRRAETANLPSKVPTPSEVASAKELARLARQAMQALPPDYREVLRLAREEQLRLADVAVRMNRTREAVKKLYGRALTRFTEEFERRGGSTHA
jgi:RNA polymerase sigma-70 factor (subfamily 1)